jgi:hypothetical protein
MLVTWKSLTALSTPTKSMIRGFVKSELIHHTDTPTTGFMGSNWLASHDAYIFGTWDGRLEVVGWKRNEALLAEKSALGRKVGKSRRDLRHLSQLSLFSEVFKRFVSDFCELCINKILLKSTSPAICCPSLRSLDNLGQRFVRTSGHLLSTPFKINAMKSTQFNAIQ